MSRQPTEAVPSVAALGRPVTYQQRDLSQALAHVRELLSQPPTTQRIYGGLCHKLPVLVRTDGLCQTLAFIAEKAGGSTERARAYQALRRHLARTLGLSEAELLDRVRTAATGQYMRYTRELLRAWVYYKRFAVSILEVEADADAEEQS